MGELDKGTENLLEGTSSWFMTEAECIESTLDELFENSTDGSDVTNLIDDEDVEQGNSLALYHTQVTEEDSNAILALKRKFRTSPEQQLVELSPRLQACSITPQKSSKRRLFRDSGLGEDEVTNSFENMVNTAEITDSNGSVVSLVSESQTADENLNLLNNSNYKAILYAKCKEKFGVSFSELSRNFKSSKTCSDVWVIFVHSIRAELLEASKVQLQQYCDYLQLIVSEFSGLYCILFKSSKNKETIQKLLCKMLTCSEYQLLLDPPRTRSLPVALYFFQRSYGNASYKFGDFPTWIKRQTTLNHEAAATADSFELSQMIQFAYDNNLLEEATIAYRYALMADTDANAAAFLKSNMQAKFVRDACSMVKYYKRQEMKDLTMSEWIWKCCDECDEEGNWKVIAHFFKYQEINLVSFLTVLRMFLKSIPKKNCIVFYGPPDTGKSYFCNSLIQFLKGKVICFMNRGSQFWLQPLIDAKIGFLDDCTYQAWSYLDVNMRGALDGNPVCIDSKHKAPQQLKLPPMLITTNVDVQKEDTLLYLKSRLQFFHFPNKFPLKSDGSVVYEITNATWKCFFSKLGVQIDLTPKEDTQNESGRSDRPFRCTAGEANELI